MAKFGEGHAAAMGRLGLAELRNAMNPSRESVADRDLGLYGSATQGEIATARGGAGDGPEQESWTLNKLRSEVEAAKEQNRDKEQERSKDRGDLER
jgi:hypothetical protein